MKAVLASLDPNFPVHEWDRLLPQIIITLNLLRAARANPKLSAYSYMHGIFNYNRTPLVPMGCKVVAHLKPTARASWAANGDDGWTVVPTMEHYRCIECFFPITRSQRHVDTVTFFPHDFVVPEVKLDDFLRQAASDIITLLTSPPSSTTVSLEEGDKTRNALLKIAETLKTAEKLPAPVKPSQPVPASSPPRVQANNKKLTSASPRVETTEKKLPGHSPRVPPLDSTHNKSSSRSLFDNTMIRNKRSFYRPFTNHQYNIRNRQAARPRLQSATDFKHLATATLVVNEIFIPRLQHIYDTHGKRMSLKNLISSDNKEIWLRALSNEWGRLADGNDFGVEATNTINFVPFSEVPKDKKVTYASFVCDERPLKKEKWRVRLVVGGDKLEYTLDAASPATDLIETKILLNSVISDSKQGARFCAMDLKDMFLHTPMTNPEYMKVPFTYFPDDIIDKYNLRNIKHSDGYVYIKIIKGMYGLKQAAILAYKNLSKLLIGAGYIPIATSQGMWKHSTRKTLFCLCIDDFGVKYHTKDDLLHLKNTIEQHYTCNVDWSGKNYLGLTLEWNYERQYVDIGMPDYIPHSLERLGYKPDVYPQYSPHPYVPINYSNNRDAHTATSEDTSPFLSVKEAKYVMKVVGSFLYYARAIDNTMLPALSQIAHQQQNPTQQTLKKCQQLMDYANTYSNTKVRFWASDMVLEVDTDAAYLVMPKARSRYAGYFRLLDQQNKPQRHMYNGAVLIDCKTIRHVVSSAAEAETKAVFHNAKTAVGLRNLLISMGHPQPVTTLTTDNSTAAGFVNKNINLKQSKSWDMNLHWLRDRENRNQFQVIWNAGKTNRADYHTKNHPISHHRKMRPLYVTDVINILYSNMKQIKRIEI